MFVPIPDIQLPNGGEIHANSTLDAEGNHAVVLHFTFPAAFPLDVVLPAGFHICKDIKPEVDAPAPTDQVMPSAEVRAALALLIDAGNMLGAQDGEHFRTAARTVHAWLYGPA